MRRGVTEWKRVPWPLWVYSAVVVAEATWLEVGLHGPVLPRVIFPFVMLAWLFFLLKGVRWVWIVAVGLSILAFVPDVISGSLGWQGVALGLVSPVLLLLPVTRRYFVDHGGGALSPGRGSAKSLRQRTLGVAAGKIQQLAARAAADPNAPIANGWFVFYLALVVVVLGIVESVVYSWHHGSGHGNVFVDVLWHVTRVVDSVLQLALIVLLVIWGSRWFGRRREKGGSWSTTSSDLKVWDGAAAGAWIKPRLGGKFGAVTLQVPKGYEAYARIFHPASDPNGNPVRWAEVAKAAGTVAHREMQWHAILGLSEPGESHGSDEDGAAGGPVWAGNDPSTGGMDIDGLGALCEILVAHTTDPSHCYFGLCTIESWQDSFSADELKPLLKLPMERDHVVLAGPLSAVDQITRGRPDLIWPADHTWFVVSEVDFDSTLVGGSAELIKAIVDSPELEAWQVEPTDSLAVDADKVNRR